MAPVDHAPRSSAAREPVSDPADNVAVMIDTLAPAPALRSARLLLTPLTHADADAVHAIFADARTWQHLPSGRHTDVEQTLAMIERSLTSLAEHGCGTWSMRLAEGGPDGPVIGVGGVTWSSAGCWNLGYRLAPEAWGKGLATEVARAGIVHARRAEPDAPVTARVLSTNPASARVLDHVGLTQVWRGVPRDGTLEVPDVERLVFSDRRLRPETLDGLIALG